MIFIEDILIRLQPFGILLQLLFGRVLFATLAIVVLAAVMRLMRRWLSTALRSWLWVCCVPALFLPFEYSVMFLMRRLGVLTVVQSFTTSGIQGYLPLAFSCMWLVGFIVCAVKTAIGQHTAIKLLKSGALSSCAAYFAGFKSRVYLPPNFERDYSPEERGMLLAHERQHIKQHDPLMYRAMQYVQCVFWFCPPVLSAVRLIRRDRELLCDERAARGFSRREYGRLLLREAAKAAPGAAIAGITTDSGGMYERIKACAEPSLTGGRNAAAVAVAAFAACVVAVGALGVINPNILSPVSVRIFYDNASELVLFDGAERFASLTEAGVSVDKAGLCDYAAAQGFSDELYIMISHEKRTLFTRYATGAGHRISDFEGSEMIIPINANIGMTVKV